MSRSALGSCCRFRSASAASRLSTRPLPAPMVPALRLTLARSDVRFAGVSPSGPPNVLAVSRSMNQRTAAKSLFFSYVTPRFSSLSSTGAKAGGAAVPVPASSVKTAARQGAGSALLRQNPLSGAVGLCSTPPCPRRRPSPRAQRPRLPRCFWHPVLIAPPPVPPLLSGARYRSGCSTDRRPCLQHESVPPHRAVQSALFWFASRVPNQCCGFISHRVLL